MREHVKGTNERDPNVQNWNNLSKKINKIVLDYYERA